MLAKILKAERLGKALKLNLILNADADVLEKVCKLEGQNINIEIKQIREKRSLDANAYFWVLIGKIAGKVQSSKDDVYLQMLQRYGQLEGITIRADKRPERFGFKYYELIKTGTGKDGKLYSSYRVYLGSSQYDKKEMMQLIEGTISECKDLGIETMTPAEIASLEVL